VPYGAAARRRRRQGQARPALAEWDPYTLPIITEVAGVARFEDLVDGHLGARGDRRSDRHLQASWSSTGGGAARQRPASAHHRHPDKKGKPIKRQRRRRSPLLLSVDAILSVETGT
jgi:DNA-directed RNA polymerase subunit beta'